MELEALLRPLLNIRERLLDVLNRIGHAEAQIALAELAESRACQARHAGLIQQRVGQLLRSPTGAGDVRESVERALRNAAGESLHLIDTGDKNVAPAAELGAHTIHRTLVAAHRLDASHLREAGGTGVG